MRNGSARKKPFQNLVIVKTKKCLPGRASMSDNMKKLDQLEQKIKIKFKNPDLLRTALVHRSYLNEHKSFELDHNERFEFLGDAVLELVVTEYLFKNFDNPEGELTNWRSSLVNYKMLSSRGDDLDLY